MNKIRELRKDELADIANDMLERSENVNASFEEAERIVQKVNEDTLNEFESEIEDLDYSFSRYGKALTISGVHSKDLFEKLVISLTEMYQEGKKQATYNKDVRYCYVKKIGRFDTMDIYLEVKTSVTGCHLVKEVEIIPEKVIAEHEEERYKVVCA